MLGNWNIRANEPGDDLSVSISSQHPHLGNYFSATLKAKRIPQTRVSDPAVFFWLMPHKVAMWIYWHVSDIYYSNLLRYIYSNVDQLKCLMSSVPFCFSFLGT